MSSTTSPTHVTDWVDRFLPEHEPRSWSAGDEVPRPIRPRTVFVQDADNGLEVAMATAERRPTTADMRKAWKGRHRGRAAPVLLVVAYDHQGDVAIGVCGPAGDEPPVHFNLDPSRVERLAETALVEPNRHAAQRCLLRLLPELETELSGLVNSGLLATHELREGVPKRSDWSSAVERGRRALRFRGRQLVEALGYSVEPLSTNTSLLKAGDQRRAVAVFLHEGEIFDAPAGRFEGVSPVAHALAIADREQLAWVILTRSSEIRLYTARPDVGVGRTGRAETFVEANLALLPETAAGYLDLLFSATALSHGGTFEQVLSSSADFAADLAARLRDRVYREAVPALAQAIARRIEGSIDEQALASAYEQTLTTLFRLLFVAYGEDKELLPYNTNSRYADHSLKRVARRLADDLNSKSLVYDEEAADLWEDVTQLWRAVDRGNKGWGVPAYDGGLFASDLAEHPVGAALGSLSLPDAEFGPALVALLVDTTPDGVIGPVDFRSLSVREFGTIYEGLLESQLSVAPTDLAVDIGGNYVPAQRGGPVEVGAGTVYLHNRSGARKATGSYFTKPFAVEHLLDQTLEPALSDHLQRVEALLEAEDGAAATAAFFDFRCADIAMGSGHFLVAAVDRIEARLSAFLALHPLPTVIAELNTLRAAALEAVGELAPGIEIETTSLIRRQVARRCIYGVDRNRMAVELARLAVWIHTFVPGLPLSFLDHNLVEGDSLIGIGTIEETLAALPGGDESVPTLFREQILDFLRRASTALRRLGTIADATVADIRAARDAHIEATTRIAPAAALFDLIVTHRLSGTPLPVSIDEDAILAAAHTEAGNLRGELSVLHFPIAFPEVFLRERSGFDCLVGNPPWETLKSEEQKFWGLRFPGLRSLATGPMNREMDKLRKNRADLYDEYLTQRARDEALRRLVLAGPYPGIGTGDPDLSEVFAWRFLQLAATSGAFGVVLPRAIFMSAGTDLWRVRLFGDGTLKELLTLTNSGGWVFDDSEHRYTIALVSYEKASSSDRPVILRGPYRSFMEYEARKSGQGASLDVTDILRWTPGAGIPLLPSEAAVKVYRKMRSQPSLVAADQPWQVRTYNELHATADRVEKGGIIDTNATAIANMWPVYKGESFGLWKPWTGIAYGWANPRLARSHLQEKRLRQVRHSTSAFFGMPMSWARSSSTLPCMHPRIAWRMVARATDTRSFYAGLLPPNVLSAHHNYLLFFPNEDHEREEAYILGVMCSMPFDWHARLWVEANFTANIVRAFPVPAATRDDPLRRRIEMIAGRLAAVDDRYIGWADAVGVPVDSVGEEERPELLAELDALVSLLFRLTQGDIQVIYETFHVGSDYSAHMERVLAHYRSVS